MSITRGSYGELPSADQAYTLNIIDFLKSRPDRSSVDRCPGYPLLDELSRRSGVSKGMVVEIEKCTANPSIGILCKIAAALGLSVADIVNVTDAPAAHIIDSQEIPTLWTGDLGGTARLLAGTTGPNMIELWRWEMFPGESFSSQGHPQGTLELFHVEKGTLKCIVGETELVIPAGSSAVAKTDVPHSYANAGRSRLVFTMSVTEIHQ